MNPYQPPPPADPLAQEDDDQTVRFYTTAANLRFAESHFVLRLHPLRLILVSLALIAASSLVMVASIMFSPLVFAFSSIAAMIISALIYLASVYRSKLRLRVNWAQHGLQDGTISSVAIDQNDLVLTSPAGVFRWPVDSVKAYRTRKGLMLSPRPMFCLFVPKRNQSGQQVYDQLRLSLGK